MITLTLTVAAISLLTLTVVCIKSAMVTRQVRRDFRRMYGNAEFSPAWTGEDGNRWKCHIETGRIVSA